VINVLKVLFDEAEVLKDKREMSDFYQQKTIKRTINKEYFKKLPKIYQKQNFFIRNKKKFQIEFQQIIRFKISIK
jgi:hypothetical protein